MQHLRRAYCCVLLSCWSLFGMVLYMCICSYINSPWGQKSSWFEFLKCNCNTNIPQTVHWEGFSFLGTNNVNNHKALNVASCQLLIGKPRSSLKSLFFCHTAAKKHLLFMFLIFRWLFFSQAWSFWAYINKSFSPYSLYPSWMSEFQK